MRIWIIKPCKWASTDPSKPNHVFYQPGWYEVDDQTAVNRMIEKGYASKTQVEPEPPEDGEGNDGGTTPDVPPAGGDSGDGSDKAPDDKKTAKK